jgi:hypothetical protein
MTTKQHCEAGGYILDFMREVLAKYGDNAKIDLHADQIRSLLAAATPNKNVPA